ncbi:hypothetical protein Tco_1360299 [Tanacetum coccineum]
MSTPDTIKEEVSLGLNTETHIWQYHQRWEMFGSLSNVGAILDAIVAEKSKGNIKEQLEDIAPAQEQLWRHKETINKFTDMLAQMQNICGEISKE